MANTSPTPISGNAVAGMLNEIGVKATVNIVEGGVFQQMKLGRKLGPLYMIRRVQRLGRCRLCRRLYTQGVFANLLADPG